MSFALYNPKDNPCKDCSERKLRCHTSCDKYKKFCNKRAKDKADKVEAIKISDTLYSNTMKRSASVKRSRPKPLNHKGLKK